MTHATTQPIDLQTWPTLYHDILRIGNLDSHVGICTLWTERDVVEKIINDKSQYAVLGNLYSGQGINAMIRNVMTNPRIRTILIWGSELSLSGHSLNQFVKDGIDQDRKIIKGRGEIEQEISDTAIAQFRKSIEVIDLRGRTAVELKEAVKRENKTPKKPFSNKAIHFPPSQPVVREMPSEQVGFRVEGKTVAQTWLKLLNEINKYGRSKHTRYAQTNELKEVLNMVAVITDEDIDQPYFPDYLPFTQGEMKAYFAEMTSPRRIPGVSYNYGFQMMEHFGVNQIDKIVELLKKRPDSKKMLATLIDPTQYWGLAGSSDTPCLTQLNCIIQDQKLFMTAHFRSHDMVHGWPRNAFGLRKLQQKIAQTAKVPLGSLCLISHSAHFYSDDFRLVEQILMDQYEKELGFTGAVHFEFEPRGNVVVEVIDENQAMVWPAFKKRYENQAEPYAVRLALKNLPKKKKQLIRATIFEPNGGPPIKSFEGRTAQEVAWQITDWNYLSISSHHMYIGLELQKAEEAIKQGKKYQQDPA